jgi:hypothetical protein
MPHARALRSAPYAATAARRFFWFRQISRLGNLSSPRDAWHMTEADLVGAALEHMARMGITLDDLASLLDHRQELYAYRRRHQSCGDLATAKVLATHDGALRLVIAPQLCDVPGEYPD